MNGWLVRDPVTVRAGDLVCFGETEYELCGDTGAGIGTGAGEGEGGRT